jgi:hypothetical protein
MAVAGAAAAAEVVTRGESSLLVALATTGATTGATAETKVVAASARARASRLIRLVIGGKSPSSVWVERRSV